MRGAALGLAHNLSLCSCCALSQPEVQVNAANWNVSTLQQPEGGENEENDEAAEDDEVWKQFQTMDEQKRKQVCGCGYGSRCGDLRACVLPVRICLSAWVGGAGGWAERGVFVCALAHMCACLSAWVGGAGGWAEVCVCVLAHMCACARGCTGLLPCSLPCTACVCVFVHLLPLPLPYAPAG